MIILGISAFYHDSSAAIIVDGEIIAAAQEERFSRIKHDASFPLKTIEFCLKKANCNISQVDAIVFYDKPLLKFERLLETYLAFAPKGFLSFVKAIPVWLKEKLFLKRLLHQELSKISGYIKKNVTILFTEHHVSHAASAYYCSGYKKAAILTIDGVGEWVTCSIMKGEGNAISMVKEMHFPHSVGLLYSAFTYYLGFKVNSGEYKLMGLAPYGNPESNETKNYIELIKNHLITIYDDGSVWLNKSFFNYSVGLTMTNDKKWKDLFGFNRRLPEQELAQMHCNLAYAIQHVTEEIVLKLAQTAILSTHCKNLCLAGGVALNCVANGKILSSNLADSIFIQPASGDAGGALGAALSTYYMYYNNPLSSKSENEILKGSYLGNQIENEEVEKLTSTYKAVFEHQNETLTQKVSKLIAEGNIIGWVQGNMEFGPRALGNRSILADPTNLVMQKKLNLNIKYRESFRPFAPAVLNSDVHKLFDINSNSNYMLLVSPIKNNLRNVIPKNYNELSMKDKLYTNRSQLQSITHVDFSARVQTVSKETNPLFFDLINEFKKISGFGVLINTSFNVRGEPIVCNADDAYRCFMRTEMDYLVINNYVFDKKKQPMWTEKNNWKTEFVLD